MDAWLEPFAFEFFRHGFYASLMVGALCGLMGVYIVLRGMSYIGHGLSHAAFGGAVLGYIFNVNFYVGAVIAGFLAALLINRLAAGNKIKSDAAIGIVSTAFFALGVALISRVREFSQSFEAALFGNILGITGFDLTVIFLVFILTSCTVFFLYKPLLFSTFDEETAKVFGIKGEWIQTIFSLLLALSIIASMNIVGVTMIAASLVIPASTARLLTDDFSKMLFLSVGIGILMGGGGMYSSFHVDAASGATIVLFGAFIFCIVLAYNAIRDKIAQHEHLHRHGEIVHYHSHAHEGTHVHEHLGVEHQHSHKHDDYEHEHEHTEAHHRSHVQRPVDDKSKKL